MNRWEILVPLAFVLFFFIDIALTARDPHGRRIPLTKRFWSWIKQVWDILWSS